MQLSFELNVVAVILAKANIVLSAESVSLQCNPVAFILMVPVAVNL